jgi:hypothetical protein
VAKPIRVSYRSLKCLNLLQSVLEITLDDFKASLHANDTL